MPILEAGVPCRRDDSDNDDGPSVPTLPSGSSPPDVARDMMPLGLDEKKMWHVTFMLKHTAQKALLISGLKLVD